MNDKRFDLRRGARKVEFQKIKSNDRKHFFRGSKLFATLTSKSHVSFSEN
jgi:hypothetical protein